MLRKSLIIMAVLAAFTMNVSAVQIEVPAGQPPIPGADANIPANAYENYRAGSLSNVGASDVIKLHSCLLYTSTISSVATVLTVYGIETI